MKSYFSLQTPKHDQVSMLKDPKFIFSKKYLVKKVDLDSQLATRTVVIPSGQKSRQLILVTSEKLVTLCRFLFTNKVLWAVFVEHFTNVKTSCKSTVGQHSFPCSLSSVVIWDIVPTLLQHYCHIVAPNILGPTSADRN